jgi:hypothetical protein
MPPVSSAAALSFPSGFIKSLSGEQLRRVSPGLTYRMEHRGGECELFECTPSGYEPVVREQINLLWG